MLVPVVKVLVFCGRPQDEGLNWPQQLPEKYKSIVIIVVALKVHLHISDSDHAFAIICGIAFIGY